MNLLQSTIDGMMIIQSITPMTMNLPPPLVPAKIGTNERPHSTPLAILCSVTIAS